MATNDIVPHEWDYYQLKGLRVYTADDQRLGIIDQVLRLAKDPTQHYLLVRASPQHSPLHRESLYIPETAVELIGEDRIVLRQSLAEFRRETGL